MIRVAVLLLVLLRLPAVAAWVNVTWDRPEELPAWYLLWERMPDGRTFNLAIALREDTSAGANFEAGTHTVYLTSVNDAGQIAEPSNEVTFKVIEVRLQSSQDGETWHDIGTYTELELPRRQFRAIFPESQ